MWAIDQYPDSVLDGIGLWYIRDMETDMTICDSSVRETLEIILELLAVCEAFIKMEHQAAEEEWYVNRIINALMPIYDAAEAAIAEVKGDQ